MSTINIGTRDGVINNLTILGTLTVPAINTPGIKSKGVSLYNATSTQTIGSSASPSVLFNSVVSNTMGTDLTLSLSNSRLTYTGADARAWFVSFSVGTATASTLVGAVFNAFIQKNGVITARYAQQYISTYGASSCVVSDSSSIPMSPGDYIELVVYQTNSVAASLTVSASTFFPSVLNVLE